MHTQPNIVVAANFWTRFKGLMFSSPLPAEKALLIPRCASVHTFFMRYALDLVYLDRRGTVIKLVQDIKPWRMSWGGSDATQIVEMTAGGIARHDIRLGDVMPICSTVEKRHAV